MAHPQSSPRGLWAKNRFDIGASNMTADSTAIKFSAVVMISASRYITADSTGFVLTTESSLPGNVDGGAMFTMISNSTGVCLAVNSTGTTWKYLSTTSLQPT